MRMSNNHTHTPLLAVGSAIACCLFAVLLYVAHNPTTTQGATSTTSITSITSTAKQKQYRQQKPLMPPPLAARRVASYMLTLTLRGSVGGAMQAVAANTTTLLVGQGATLLLVPFHAVTPTAHLTMADLIQDIAVVENYAYVAVGDKGVQVVHIATPSAPRLVATLTTGGAATSMHGTPAYGYITTTGANGGVDIVDILTPTHPLHLFTMSTLATRSASAVDVVGNRLYVATGRGKIVQVFDITSPYNPVLLGEATLPASAMDVQVEGTSAYVAADSSGLQVVDVQDDTTPQRIGSAPTDARANAVAVVQDVAYVAADSAGLYVFDVSNPQRPTRTAHVALPGNANDVVVVPSQQQVYVAAQGGGLHAIDVTMPVSPAARCLLPTLYGAIAVAVSQHQVYVAAGSAGLYVVNGSNPLTPTYQQMFTATASVQDVRVVDDVVYVAADADGVYVLNTTHPMSDMLQAHINVPGRVTSLAITDTLLAVAAGSSGVFFFDVSNPLSPTMRGKYDTPGSALAVQVEHNIAYIADQDSIHMLDITNIVSPTMRATYSMDTHAYVHDLAVENGIVYVAAGGVQGGMMVLDAHTPNTLTLLATTHNPATAVVPADNNKLFVTTIYGDVVLYSVENPAIPKQLCHYQVPGVAHDLAVNDTMLYVADFDGGIHLIELHEQSDVLFLPFIQR